MGPWGDQKVDVVQRQYSGVNVWSDWDIWLEGAEKLLGCTIAGTYHLDWFYDEYLANKTPLQAVKKFKAFELSHAAIAAFIGTLILVLAAVLVGLFGERP